MSTGGAGTPIRLDQLLVNRAPARLLPLPRGFIGAPGMETHRPSCTGHKVKDYVHVSEAEAITALWWLVTPAKSWPVCLAITEATLHGVLTLPAPRQPNILGFCSPLGYHRCLNAADALSGYSVADAAPVQSSDSRYSIVALKLNYAMFPAFQTICNLITVHLFFWQWPPNNRPIVKTFDDIPHSLASTGI